MIDCKTTMESLEEANTVLKQLGLYTPTRLYHNEDFYIFCNAAVALLLERKGLQPLHKCFKDWNSVKRFIYKTIDCADTDALTPFEERSLDGLACDVADGEDDE